MIRSAGPISAYIYISVMPSNVQKFDIKIFSSVTLILKIKYKKNKFANRTRQAICKNKCVCSTLLGQSDVYR